MNYLKTCIAVRTVHDHFRPTLITEARMAKNTPRSYSAHWRRSYETKTSDGMSRHGTGLLCYDESCIYRTKFHAFD